MSPFYYSRFVSLQIITSRTIFDLSGGNYDKKVKIAFYIIELGTKV